MSSERPTAVVFTGLRLFTKPGIDEIVHRSILPRGPFDLVIPPSLEWEDPRVSHRTRESRIRQGLVEQAERSERPVRAVGISGSVPMLLETAHDLGPEVVDGVIGIVGAVNPTQGIPEDLAEALKHNAPPLHSYLESFYRTTFFDLAQRGMRNVVSFRGTRDDRVPPSMTDYGDERVTLRTPSHPHFPPGSELKSTSHAINIFRSLRSSRFRSALSGAAA